MSSGIEWRKSSRSGASNNCVEVAYTDEWRKSSRSGADNNCVEVAVGAAIARLRDTKARAAGTLSFDAAAFGSFVRVAKDGLHES